MRSTEARFSAAILAGGRNTRLGGRNKALIEKDGKTLVGSAVELLASRFGEVLIISSEPRDYAGLDVKIFADMIPGKGPLGGIHSALSNASGDAVFIVACDMPFLDGGLIGRELEAFKRSECDILVPRVGDLIEPLHSVYASELAATLGEHLVRESNRSIRHFFSRARVAYWDVSGEEAGRAFANLNDAEDVKRFEDLTRGGR